MRVLVIGATGSLGRPVTRRLLREGVSVRALSRDCARARRLLPPECEIVAGDLQDDASLASAMEKTDAVYLNLASPFSVRTRFDPDRDGTRNVIRVAERVGVRRVLRLSAMEVPDAAGSWWVIDRKRNADDALTTSDLAWTLFRPTWFMESLAYFLFGRLLTVPAVPVRLRWLAADDYARQVVRALGSEAAIRRTYYPQGPELVSFAEAAQRFARAFPDRLLSLPLPLWLLRLGGLALPMPRYLADLISTLQRHQRMPDPEPEWAELGAPNMRIEDYVRYMLETGDRPSKLPRLG